MVEARLRAAIGLTLALALWARHSSAQEDCSLRCELRVVADDCSEGRSTLASGTPLEVVFACRGGCQRELAVAEPRVVGVPCGEAVVGRFEPTGRSCDDLPVQRFSLLLPSGRSYRIVWLDESRAEIAVGEPSSTTPDCRTQVAEDVHPPDTPPQGRHPAPPPLPPPEEGSSPSEPVRDFDARPGSIVEVGLGPFAAVTGRTDRSGTELGGYALIGLHHVDSFVSESQQRAFARTITIVNPLLPLVALLGPSDAILGNEQGVDLRLSVRRAFLDDRDPTTAYEALVDPVFKVSFGRWRTDAMLGSLVPYVGAEKSPDTALAASFGWSIYPFDYRLTNALILAFDPVALGFRVPLDGDQVSVQGTVRVGLHFTPLSPDR